MVNELGNAKESYFKFLSRIKMSHNELSVSIIVDYIVSEQPYDERYSKLLQTLPDYLITEITKMVNVHCRINKLNSKLSGICGNVVLATHFNFLITLVL